MSCDFAPGTVLKDYSGANGTATVTVSGSQTVAINTPPCNGTAAGGRRGYSVWAPANAVTDYTTPGPATTQEWELANDLGDSDSRSLMQGGALPAASTAYRTAGRIYVAANKSISYTLFPTDATRSLTVAVLNSAGTVVSSQTGTGNLTGTYTPTTEGWYTLKAKNASTANPSQGAFVKATYTAPTVVTGAMTGRRDAAVLANAQEAPAAEVLVYPNPTAADRIDVVITANREQAATVQPARPDGPPGAPGNRAPLQRLQRAAPRREKDAAGRHLPAERAGVPRQPEGGGAVSDAASHKC